MEFVWYVIAGVLGGVLGGMGMGGGTVLIPLLTIFYATRQHTAQAVNLVSFIPMAVVAIIIHLKNRLIDFKYLCLIIIPGVLSAILGFYVARSFSGDLLKRIFGGFLILLSIFRVVTELKKSGNNN